MLIDVGVDKEIKQIKMETWRSIAWRELGMFSRPSKNGQIFRTPHEAIDRDLSPNQEFAQRKKR